MTANAKAFIGTSGWVYKHWKERFYSTSLKSAEYLRFYATQFPTAEINNSFYKLPSLHTYEKWASEVGPDFVFAVKASRYLTHMKKLKDPAEPWKLITEHAALLENHLGPIFLQFPQRWEKNTQRLQEFLEVAFSGDAKYKLAFEFRHPTWFESDVISLLEKYNCALCIADSSKFSQTEAITANFTYLRYHGPEGLYSSNYSNARLEKEANKISHYLKRGITVFAYFNNDADAKAVHNAKTLISLVR